MKELEGSIVVLIVNISLIAFIAFLLRKKLKAGQD
jgi:hypothetical protein